MLCAGNLNTNGNIPCMNIESWKLAMVANPLSLTSQLQEKLSGSDVMQSVDSFAITKSLSSPARTRVRLRFLSKVIGGGIKNWELSARIMCLQTKILGDSLKFAGSYSPQLP